MTEIQARDLTMDHIDCKVSVVENYCVVDYNSPTGSSPRTREAVGVIRSIQFTADKKVQIRLKETYDQPIVNFGSPQQMLKQRASTSMSNVKLLGSDSVTLL